MFGDYVPPGNEEPNLYRSESVRNKHISASLEESDLSENDEIPGEDRITLSWKGISVNTKPKGCGSKKSLPKQILRDVDGQVAPCSLMALMGASGAGKTTLLNILNFRNRQGLQIDGNVYINGHPVNQTDMSVNSVFVQQQDLFMGGLKVKEHLNFHAHLRMRHAKKSERNERVEVVMRQMGLKKCENVRIGEPGRTKGISGGEAKRLAFATEIICKPTLIFCDEPTSGLDSFMAMSLAKLLKRYAAAGRTILCTIHQPSSQTFELFDQICIMAEGRCAFIGATSDCLKAFAKAGYPCPRNYNPADFFIFTLAVVPGKEDKCKEVVARIMQTFEESEQCATIKQDISDQIETPGSRNFRDNKRKSSCCGVIGGWIAQVYQLFLRQTIATLREPQSFALRLVIAVVISLIFGATWFQLDFRKLASRQSVPGALFAIALAVSMSAVMLLIIVIPENLAVVTRDYLSNVYTIPNYYIAIVMFFTIEVFVTSMIIICVIYWMVFSHNTSRPESAGIDAAGNFPMILGTNLMVAAVSVSIGLFISANASSFQVATSMATPMLTIFMMFSGFLVIVDDIPPYFKPLQFISHFYYGMELSMVAIYGNQSTPCEMQNKTNIAKLSKAFRALRYLRYKKEGQDVPEKDEEAFTAGLTTEEKSKMAEEMNAFNQAMQGAKGNEAMITQMKTHMQSEMAKRYSEADSWIKGNLTTACHKISKPEPSADCGNYARGSDMLKHFHFEEDHTLRNFLCLLGITLSFHLIAFLILCLKMWKKRK